MRRTLIAVFLLVYFALPVCAQRFGGSARGGHSGFARSQPAGGGARSVAIPRYQSGIRFGGGIAFGHNPRWIITTSSRPHWGFRSHYRPYWSSYVYPYFFSPFYALPYYDNFGTYGSYGAYAPAVLVDETPEAYVAATPQPYYPYFPGEQAGLDTQMRQQQVGIYRPPVQQEAAPSTQPAPIAAQPSAEQPATVLVYRDGRRTEVRNYAVVGQTLWIFSEQRAQKTPLSNIDIAATQRANADRGIDFTVPAPK